MKRDQYGLAAWTGSVTEMREPHQHDEIEFNLVLEGELHYSFGGHEVRLGRGQWMAFWGAWPHHLTHSPPETRCVWVTLPFATHLRFGLPDALNRIVFSGQPVLQPEPNHEDRLVFLRWASNGQSETAEAQRILELELEARLRRLALGLRAPHKRARGQQSKAALLAQFVAAHYLEPIGLPEIAQGAHLSPNHASGMFKQQFSMTLLEYLTQHRVAHAQRLLATSQSGVLEVAFESGFASSSAFYAAFKRACSLSPLEYRRRQTR